MEIHICSFSFKILFSPNNSLVWSIASLTSMSCIRNLYEFSISLKSSTFSSSNSWDKLNCFALATSWGVFLSIPVSIRKQTEFRTTDAIQFWERWVLKKSGRSVRTHAYTCWHVFKLENKIDATTTWHMYLKLLCCLVKRSDLPVKKMSEYTYNRTRKVSGTYFPCENGQGMKIVLHQAA